MTLSVAHSVKGCISRITSRPAILSTSPLGANTRLDRRMARRDFGMQRGIVEDLLAQVGRRRKHHPVFAVGADGDAACERAVDAAVALISEAAVRAKAIPLRQAAAGCGTKHKKSHLNDPIPAIAHFRGARRIYPSYPGLAGTCAERGKRLEQSYILDDLAFARVRPPRENRQKFVTAAPFARVRSNTSTPSAARASDRAKFGRENQAIRFRPTYSW